MALSLKEKSEIVEKSILDTWPNKFNKNPDGKLVITLEDNSKMVLENEQEYEWQPKINNLVIAYWPERHKVVVNHYKQASHTNEIYMYSVNSTVEFNRSKTCIYGWPLLSPRENYVATFSANEKNGFNGIAIIPLDKFSRQHDFVITGDDLGVTYLKWKSDSQIEFMVNKKCKQGTCIETLNAAISNDGIKVFKEASQIDR